MADGMRRKLKIEFCHSSWESEVPMELHFELLTSTEIRQSDYFSSLFGSEKHSNYHVLVGLNASGKTTLLTLLQEFYSSFEDMNRTQKLNFKERWAAKGVTFFKSTMLYELQNNQRDFDMTVPDEWESEDIRTDEAFRLFCHAVKNGVSAPPDEFLVNPNGEWDENYDVQINKAGYLDRLDNDNEYDFYDLACSFIRHDNEVPEDSEASILIELITELNMETTNIDISANLSFEHIYQTFGKVRQCNLEFTKDLSVNQKVDFHSLIQQMFDRINNESDLKVSSTKIFGYPHFEEVSYLSSDEISKTPPASEELVHCMQEFDAIEDKLEHWPISDIFKIFDVEKFVEQTTFGNRIHSFKRIPYDHAAGSEENLGKLNEYEKWVKKKLNLQNPYGVGTLENWRFPNKIVEINLAGDFSPNSGMWGMPHGFLWVKNPLYSSDESSKNVYICDIGIHGYTENNDVIRFFEDVVVLPNGYIYSDNMNSLHYFLTRDVWRICSDSKKRDLFSRIFDVGVDEVNGYRAVQELSKESNFNNYLSSGQERIYSIIKKSSTPNSEILLIDEPEVSLHIDWQRKIVDLIRKYSKAKVILIATHSPDVIYHHLDKVIELNSQIED
jgi:ABC-type cobalamin/Fe3+-siderophores transport system ATPase subunit